MALTFLYPMEVIKTRIQIQGEIKKSRNYKLSNIAAILRSEGLHSLYRGFSISLFTIPVFNTLYFPIYEKFKHKFKQDFGWKENDTKLYSLSAAAAGSLCNLITNPLWVIRTRMQTEIFFNSSTEHFNKKYAHGPLSVFTNILEIVKLEGFRSLYKGFSATMVGIIHPIIFFPLYEKLKIHLKKNYDKESEDLSTKFIVLATITSKLISSAVSYPHEVLRSRL